MDFSRWIYDHLLPHSIQIRVAHPFDAASDWRSEEEERQDRCRQIADCLRCDFLPERHMMPGEIRDRRRTLRYQHLLVRQTVQMKNCVFGLLMEAGEHALAP
jgi:transposase